MIWEYSENSRLEFSAVEQANFDRYGYGRLRRCLSCHFCMSQMTKLEFEQNPGVGGCTETHVEVCPACGWWVVTHYVGYNIGYEGFTGANRAAGILRTLDLTDISIPTGDLARYLLGHYDDRFWLHPKKYEDIVAGVFSDFGFEVNVTSYSKDDGIDVFVFDNDQGETVGVQVKRYRGKIGAQQIRSFAGAMLLHGLTTGIYVTTSRFTKCAQQTSHRYREVGTAIELWDAEHFYERLRISKLCQFASVDDPTTPYFHLMHNSKEVPQVFGFSW